MHVIYLENQWKWSLTKIDGINEQIMPFLSITVATETFEDDKLIVFLLYIHHIIKMIEFND